MNEHDKEKFKVNMALIKNCLDGIDNDKLRTENLIKTEVSVIRRLIKELEEMVEAENVVNIREEGTGMKEEYIHVFKRNMDTVNVTLEHVLYNSSIPRDMRLSGSSNKNRYANCIIRITVFSYALFQLHNLIVQCRIPAIHFKQLIMSPSLHNSALF